MSPPIVLSRNLATQLWAHAIEALPYAALGWISQTQDVHRVQSHPFQSTFQSQDVFPKTIAPLALYQSFLDYPNHLPPSPLLSTVWIALHVGNLGVLEMKAYQYQKNQWIQTNIHFPE